MALPPVKTCPCDLVFAIGLLFDSCDYLGRLQARSHLRPHNMWWEKSLQISHAFPVLHGRIMPSKQGSVSVPGRGRYYNIKVMHYQVLYVARFKGILGCLVRDEYGRACKSLTVYLFACPLLVLISNFVIFTFSRSNTSWLPCSKRSWQLRRLSARSAGTGRRV
jgi:hypothetical protein